MEREILGWSGREKCTKVCRMRYVGEVVSLRLVKKEKRVQWLGGFELVRRLFGGAGRPEKIC